MKRIDKQVFFWENPQMLGFSNPARATVMIVKEIVDNALDACEEAGVLPQIIISITSEGDIFTVRAKDNGVGIPPNEVENAFGELLFGSKFDTYKQTRGQQGIGVSAAFLWSQKTVGEPVRVITKTKDNDAWEFILTTKGRGILKVKSKRKIDVTFEHGTIVEMKFRGSWQSKRHLQMYLEGVALANPHASIHVKLNGEELYFERRTDVLPHVPREVSRHPHAVDVGLIEEIASMSTYRKLKSLLMDNFALGKVSISKIEAQCPFINNPPNRVSKEQLRKLVDVIKSMKFPLPSSECLSPLGEEIIHKSLQRYSPQLISAVKRHTSMYNGHPFIVECGIAYGGQIDEFKLFRVANRVPLVYDEGACAITHAIKSVNWKSYGFKQNKNEFPNERIVAFVHFCSTSVPFGNQAKTYVVPDEHIVKEIKLALQQALRDISGRIARKQKKEKQEKKFEEKLNIAVLLASKVYEILEVDEPPPYESIAKICGAELVSDEENNTDKIVVSKKRIDELFAKAR
ncbi:MAG: DNA topoisomerase VI subunit B [Candidatus Thorarchaeota archaeon]